MLHNGLPGYQYRWTIEPRADSAQRGIVFCHCDLNDNQCISEGYKIGVNFMDDYSYCESSQEYVNIDDRVEQAKQSLSEAYAELDAKKKELKDAQENLGSM